MLHYQCVELWFILGSLIFTLLNTFLCIHWYHCIIINLCIFWGVLSNDLCLQGHSYGTLVAMLCWDWTQAEFDLSAKLSFLDHNKIIFYILLFDMSHLLMCKLNSSYHRYKFIWTWFIKSLLCFQIKFDNVLLRIYINIFSDILICIFYSVLGFSFGILIASQTECFHQFGVEFRNVYS